MCVSVCIWGFRVSQAQVHCSTWKLSKCHGVAVASAILFYFMKIYCQIPEEMNWGFYGQNECPWQVQYIDIDTNTNTLKIHVSQILRRNKCLAKTKKNLCKLLIAVIFLTFTLWVCACLLSFSVLSLFHNKYFRDLLFCCWCWCCCCSPVKFNRCLT